MLRHLTAFVAIGTLAVGGVACAAPPQDDNAQSSTSGLSEIGETGIDAQVLQVWTPSRLFPLPPQGWQGPGPHDVAINAPAPPPRPAAGRTGPSFTARTSA